MILALLFYTVIGIGTTAWSISEGDDEGWAIGVGFFWPLWWGVFAAMVLGEELARIRKK